MADPTEAGTTDEVNVNCSCPVVAEPVIVRDDDPSVFAIICDVCGDDLAFLIDRTPDPCPFHTDQEGPHHATVCCYYADEYDPPDATSPAPDSEVPRG